MPAVSVIVPTFNRADLLPQAIDSVLSQTRTDIEVIVIDDASTDGTADVIQRYGDDARIRYLRNTSNAGIEEPQPRAR